MLSKRKLSVFLIVACIALSLVVSCSKRDTETPGKITLNVLNYMDLTSPNTIGEIDFVWNGFLDRNEDIVINREDLYNEPYHNKVEAYVASGNLPDVMYVWPSGRSASLHQNRLLKDLAPLIQKDGIFADYLHGVGGMDTTPLIQTGGLENSYLPAALDPANQGGGYFAMFPIALTSSHAFYINMEVLNACGLSPAKTYAELKAQVPVLKARGYETVIMPNKDSWVMQSCLFSLIAGRFGGAGWEKKILSGEANFTDPDFVQALDFIRQLYADGVLSGASLGTSYGDSPGMFATNKGAYMIDGDWRVGAFLTDQSTGQALIGPERQKNILITVFPEIEGAKLNGSTSGVLGTGWAMNAAIPAGSAKEEAAWKLIKWLTGKEVTAHRVESGGIATPVWVDIDYSAMNLEPMQIAIGNLINEYTVSTCVIDGVFHSDIFNPLNDGLAEIGMGAKTPTQVAAEVQRMYDAWKRNR